MFFSAFPPFFPIPGFYPPYLSPVCSTPGSRLTPWCRWKYRLQTLSSLGPDPSLSLAFSHDLYFSSSVVFWLLSSPYLIVHIPTVWCKNDLPVCVCVPRGKVWLREHSQHLSAVLSLSSASPLESSDVDPGTSPQPLSLWAPTCPEEASKHFHLSWLEDFEVFRCFWWVINV